LDKRIAVMTIGLLLIALLAGCKANPAPTSTPTQPLPTVTSAPPTAAPNIPAVSTEGWTVYEVPDEQFAIALPPTWGNVDMDSTMFTASLQAAMAKYPDVASTIQGEAYSLINAGVHFFGFDPASEAMKTGSTTDASVQRQSMGSEATLAQIEQLVRTQLSNAASVKQPVSTRVIGLAAGGYKVFVSAPGVVNLQSGVFDDPSPGNFNVHPATADTINVSP